MSSFQRNVQNFGLLRRSIRYVDYRSAITGKLNADGSLNPNPREGLPDGYIWVRLGDGDRSAVPVKCLKMRDDAAGARVIVALNFHTGEMEALEVDSIAALEQFGASAASLNVPRLPADVSTPVLARDFVAGGVFAADTGGLTVRLGAYWHMGGYWDGTTVITLTPTATSGKHSLALVGVNPLTNAGVVTLSVNRELAQTLIDASGALTTLGASDALAVMAADQDTDWRGAVDLANGATAVDPAMIVPLGQWRASVMVGADGANAGIAGLVPAPAAADDGKYLRGNGVWDTPSIPSGTVSFSGARVYNSGDLTATNNTTYEIPFDSENYDAGGYHSVVSNTTRLTVVTTGYHSIKGQLEIQSSTSTVRRLLQIRLDGSTILATVAFFDSNDTDRHQIVTDYYLTAGQYVELLIFQNTGSNRTLPANGCWFSMYLLGT